MTTNDTLPVLLAAMLLTGCGGVTCTADRVEDIALDFAGPDAVECADVPCLFDAVEGGTAAYTTGSTQGIDSVIRRVTVAVDGELWFFSHDPLGAAAARRCVDPELLGTDAIDCGSTEPAGNHYSLCGGTGGSSPTPIPFEDRP